MYNIEHDVNMIILVCMKLQQKKCIDYGVEFTPG